MHITTKRDRRINKYHRKDDESKIAFAERCTISKRHDLPHVSYYECNDMDTYSIIEFLQKYKQWYRSQTCTLWQLYFQRESLKCFADRDFLDSYKTSSQNPKVQHIHIIYMPFI